MPDVIVTLTSEQALAAIRALRSHAEHYEKQLSMGIKGTNLPDQEPVSFTERLRLARDTQLAIACEYTAAQHV